MFCRRIATTFVTREYGDCYSMLFAGVSDKVYVVPFTAEEASANKAVLH